MKKIFQIIIAITVILPYFNSIQAQNLNDSEALAFVDFNNIEERNTKYDSKSNLYNSEAERKAKAEAYDQQVLEEFGSYLNPYSGTLNIVNNKNTHFTKAQFSNKSSNEKIFSMKIDTEIKKVDISKYKAGEYILILSNNGGDIHVENFIII